MQVQLCDSRLQLQPYQPLSLRQAQGWQVHCLQGKLWLTQQDHSQDVILRAGERYRIANDKQVLIEALDGGGVVRLSSVSTTVATRASTQPRLGFSQRQWARLSLWVQSVRFA